MQEVLGLLRVVHHIEELLVVAIGVDVLVPLVPQHAPALAVPLVLHVLVAPVLDPLAKDALPRQVVDVGVFGPGGVQEGGQHVVEVDKAGIPLSRRHLFGPVDDEGDLAGGVVGEEFLVGAQVPQHLAVVAGEEDQGVVVEVQLLEFFHDPPHLEVHVGDGRRVHLPHPLHRLRGGQVAQGLVLLRQQAQGGLGDRGGGQLALVHLGPLVGDVQGGMGVDEPGPEEEGPPAPLLVQVLDRAVGHPVGAVQLFGHQGPLGLHVEAVAHPVDALQVAVPLLLQKEHVVVGLPVGGDLVHVEEVVKAVHPPLGLKVHLSHGAGVVAVVREDLGEGGQIVGQGLGLGPEVVVVKAVVAVGEPGEQVVPGGDADRVGGVGVFIHPPLGGQGVDVGRLHEVGPVAAQIVAAQLIAGDEEDVGTPVLLVDSVTHGNHPFH